MEFLWYYLLSIVISYFLVRWATIIYLKNPNNDINKSQFITVIIFILVPFFNILWASITFVHTLKKSSKVSALKLFKSIFIIRKK